MTNTKLVLATLTAVAGLGAGIILAPQFIHSSLAEDTITPGQGQGASRGAKFQNSETWQALQTAMDNKDFSAWQTARENMAQERQNMAQQRHQTMTDLIDSQEDFNKWIEARNLRQAGDFDGANTLLKELGFTEDNMPGMGKGRGMGRSGNCPNQ